jgi:hypothetical protein
MFPTPSDTSASMEAQFYTGNRYRSFKLTTVESAACTSTTANGAADPLTWEAAHIGLENAKSWTVIVYEVLRLFLSIIDNKSAALNMVKGRDVAADGAAGQALF